MGSRERVRITPGAARQILSHSEVLNEDVVTNIVISLPKRKRVYYTSNRFTLKVNRKVGNIWKSVLIRVEENVHLSPSSKITSEIEYVVLLVHVESS